MKAVIPAAGLGTRLLPATKAQPKEMLPVYDRPTIHYVIEEALASGIDDILIVTGRNKRSIEDYFDKSYELEYTLQKAGKDRDLKKVRKITDLADICYVRQKNLIGLGDAISCAERHIGDEPFAVLLGDSITRSKTPLTKQLIDVFSQYNKSTIAIRQVTPDRISRHGIVSGSAINDNVYKIDNLVEKPNVDEAQSDLAIVGRYIITPDIFDKISQTEPGFNGEIQLTDALSKMDEVYGVKFDGDVFNIENRLEWLKSSINFAMYDDEFKDDLISYMKTFI
ncbi:MAG: UTP--glucose-1-phosphate uridylyltransferase GalU [Methanobrevibacter sp.]|jgi:UTP--glucose-1-phosphate uridylyltransferase|uniref:UTP--glucose-1-phosphate uridylyltransferase GalU n=1 Tax=Methanobrevibacter sp. TaxID=66852 RepID=UPI0025FE1C9E|nr:UTP--glucose-1-phosphate uridylyltransferase GalU [Methanobrevibacter sp.]MBE6497310.1 UTP--glucose-1-phosphate uridylyltransferase GalU [Methanobrevibacter sp.]